MTPDLFDKDAEGPTGIEQLAPGAVVLRGFAGPHAPHLVAAIDEIAASAPFRHMLTPGGQRMSAAMTNCGPLGWISDRRGYRYESCDPLSGTSWPPLPPSFLQLAADAATAAGFLGFVPDACLINRYEPGTRMSLHQDRDEQDLTAPIVSVSLGLPAVFLFGGLTRGESSERIPLMHGDVVVWGGPSRLRFHGILPLKDAAHSLLGRQRINLTFRKAT
ncbi:Alkylated DNA repair protein alkB [Azoarcus sp. CIB]|uniref:DNA oxidative demethylase AlkB n=1 Tax=Aromatoleum sp. (strain CIB) TaxID=198107 RepID=UPI00067DAC7F|nr:DNA oxidative demethylase AlkB [Azoarcus sp. CIB]AKU12779.1 Alkylated DNA repair protein alkB [Azoarcus sp. CIB]